MRIAVASLFLGAAAFLLVGTANFSAGQDKKEPKYNIKQVMKMAHKGGAASLRAKVLSKTATKEEQKKLIELYESMCQSKPPKGDAKAFKKRCEKILAAAKGAIKGNAKAINVYKKVTACGACHKKFK